VNLEVAAEVLLLPDLRQIGPRTAEPLVGFPGLLHVSTP
jgi:hypothetical protein